MANEELKKKIIEILEEGQTPVEYDDGDWGQTYFPTNEDVADALIAAGIGDVKETQHRTEVTERALDTVYKEACEKYEKEIKQLMRNVFGDYIANGIGGYIDNIKERLLEEGYEH